MQPNGRYRRSQERTGLYATDHYTSPQIAARNRLASCCALAILSPGRRAFPNRDDAGAWQDLLGNAGIIEQGHIRTASCPAGARQPDRFSHAPRLPSRAGRVSKMRRLHRTARRSGTCCTCPPGGGSTRYSRASLREMHRSIRRRNRVNSFNALTLSLELCRRFLNEWAPPVNIAYERQIMSRACDMSGPNRFLLV
jgi:hypothetical protein